MKGARIRGIALVRGMALVFAAGEADLGGEVAAGDAAVQVEGAVEGGAAACKDWRARSGGRLEGRADFAIER